MQVTKFEAWNCMCEVLLNQSVWFTENYSNGGYKRLNKDDVKSRKQEARDSNGGVVRYIQVKIKKLMDDHKVVVDVKKHGFEPDGKHICILLCLNSDNLIYVHYITSGGGRRVKKNQNQALNNKATKDGVVPSDTVASGNNTSTQDENVRQCSYTAPLNEGNVSINTNDSSPSLSRHTSYTNLVTGEPSRNVSPTTRKTVNFRTLITPAGNGPNVVVPLESIRVISERFEDTDYGFFWGKRVAYLVVANYVRNTWNKYGLVKIMLNSSNGLFLFQFNSKDGLDTMLENGPCFILNNPLILLKWNPNVRLLKKEVGNVPVWVKLHGVHLTAFSEDGLSAITTILGAPLMLDSYTSDIYIIVVAMPKLVGEAFYMCTIRVEYKWKPPRCSSCKVFVHVLDECPKTIGSVVVKNLKTLRQAARVDDDLGTNGGNSKSARKGSLNVVHGSSSNTHIIKNIDKLERRILDGKLAFVNDDGKPLYKFVTKSNEDSESKAEVVLNETVNLMASTSLKGGSNRGYDTNSLLEQWR
ncbi:hypothetical protein Tco_0900300 [Tanacetum coccineum]